MKLQVRKRNGTIVPFNEEKIVYAMSKGFLEFGEMTEEKEDCIKNTVEIVEKEAKKYEDAIEVEEIQDIIVAQLRKAGFRKVAKGYQEYREKRTKERELKTVLEILSNEATDEKNDAGIIYPHDLGWGTTTMTCVQIDIPKLFKNGFSTGHGYLREPSNIKTAFLQSAIAIQSNQNDMWGGQSIPQYDFALAPYVLKSYKKHLKKLYAYEHAKTHDSADAEMIAKIDALTSINDVIPELEYMCKAALANTEEDTYQGAESLVHNLNSMASRAGSQVPFSSLNFGLDTSPEGRMVASNLLKAQMSGLGRHETPIFPILIYTLKKGVNFEKEDPNYDIFRLAMECSSKRLFPTYCFVDASFNLPYYEKDPYYGAIQTINKTCGFKTHLNGGSPTGITHRAKLHLLKGSHAA